MDDKLNDLLTSTSIRVAIIGVLAILSLYLFAKTWATVEMMGEIHTSDMATITVTGTGKASAAPNIAHISFSVEQKGTTGEDAQNKATKTTNAALDAVKKLGIAEKDIQTSGYQVSPQYEQKACPNGTYCPPNQGNIVGYMVTQSVDVKVRDTARTGEVLQVLAKAGVQNVSGPNFMIDDQTDIQAEARSKAILDARAKATVLASQLGVHLGKVVGFSEGGNAFPVYQAMTKSADVAGMGAPAPSVPVGENEVNSTVTVIFQIK